MGTYDPSSYYLSDPVAVVLLVMVVVLELGCHGSIGNYLYQ